MRKEAVLINYKVEELSLYQKKQQDIHFIPALDIVSEGKEIIVPTLEGNVKIKASSKHIILIGLSNDIYPIPSELFASRYTVIEDETDPQVTAQIEALNWPAKAVRKCRLSKEAFVYAKEVPFDFKVYVKQCDSVICGKAGDYYAVSYEDVENSYIIQAEIMKNTYSLVSE